MGRLKTIAAAALAGGACAAAEPVTVYGQGIETNAAPFMVTVPTVFSGVTNVNTSLESGCVIADMTLENRSFIRIAGRNGTSGPWIDFNAATNANDVTITLNGNSAFLTTYRHSDGNYVNGNGWVDTHIDGDVPNKFFKSSYVRFNVGESGADAVPDSTGRFKVKVNTTPNFGNNAKSSFWAAIFHVGKSVKAEENGYVDAAEINVAGNLDIPCISTECPHPVRILFNAENSWLIRSNGGVVWSGGCQYNFKAAPGSKIVLEGAEGVPVRMLKMFQQGDFTDPNVPSASKGQVEFRGAGVVFKSNGNTVNDNFHPWNMRALDNIVWKHAGWLKLEENCWLRVYDDNILPCGEGQDGVEIGGHRYGGAEGFHAHSCIDLYGTEQTLRNVTSLYAHDHVAFGVVTNTLAGSRGTLVLDNGAERSRLAAKCAPGVTVRKRGTGALSVEGAKVEDELIAEAGSVAFGKGSAARILECAAGVALSGEVEVRERLEYTGGARWAGLELKLAEGAKVKIYGEGTVDVLTLEVAGAAAAPGVYTPQNCGWVESGSVRVLLEKGIAAREVTWKGTADSAAFGDAANWLHDGDAPADFSAALCRAVFADPATAAAEAVLGADEAFVNGILFNAPYDAGITTNGPAAGIFNLGQIEAENPDTEQERVYRVNAPVTVTSDLTFTIQTNTALELTGGVAADRQCNAVMQGVKGNGGNFDYSVGGRLLLERFRVPGDFAHTTGGGKLVIRGEFGVPGDPGLFTVDYGHTKDNSQYGEWVRLGDTRIENATIRKKVRLSGQGQISVAKGVQDFFIFGAGTTNVLAEPVEYKASTALKLENHASVTFAKGITDDYPTGNGGLSFWPGAPDGRGTGMVLAFDGPAKTHRTDKSFDLTGWMTVKFNAQGNFAGQVLNINCGKVEFNAEKAFAPTWLKFAWWDYGTEVELNATHQQFRRVTTQADKNHHNRTSVHGSEGSVFEVTEGSAADSADVCALKFTGAATARKTGSGIWKLVKAAHASTGAVEALGGTLWFSDGSTWMNGSEVKMGGGGTLKLDANAFAESATVEANGEWKLDLAKGVKQKFEEFRVDGRKLAGGSWGSSESKADNVDDAHFSGEGVVLLPVRGTVIVVR